MATARSAEDLAVVILAAGRGTRLRSDTAKVLHPAAGRTLLRHVLESVRPLDAASVVVVVGHQAEVVRAELERAQLPGATTVEQVDQRGTGHAVLQALPALGPRIRRVMVLPGDTPLLTPGVLAALGAGATDGSAALLTTELTDPSGYGRVLRSGDGSVDRIVEEADADPAERAVTECNAGMYLFGRQDLTAALTRVGDDNAQGEQYLTDVVGILRAEGATIAAVPAAAETVAGVNDRRQLADAAARLRRRHLDALMIDVGVTVTDLASTHVDVDVEIGRDTVLHPGTILDSGTRIGSRAVIGPNSHLSACTVADDAVVHSTRAVEAEIGPGVSVGPFTHLRPGTRLSRGARAGAFVETKNVSVGEDSKIPHLSYVGDATVGTGVNLACGVITVNYDGRDKHHTIVEDGAFVGCDTMLVAPVTIGATAYTAAGSVITEDVPPGALAIARSRQTVKEGWADRRREQDG